MCDPLHRAQSREGPRGGPRRPHLRTHPPPSDHSARVGTTTDTGTSATVYDFTSDFDDITNPNGVWTYGWAADLGAPMVVFPDASMSGANGSPAWRDFDNMMLGARPRGAT